MSMVSGLMGGLLIRTILVIIKLKCPQPAVQRARGLFVSQPWWVNCRYLLYCFRKVLSSIITVLLRPSSLQFSVTMPQCSVLCFEGWTTLWKNDFIPLFIFPKFLLPSLNLTESRFIFRNLSRLIRCPWQMWQVQYVPVRMSWTRERVLISLLPMRLFSRAIRYQFMQLWQGEFMSSKVLKVLSIMFFFFLGQWLLLSKVDASSFSLSPLLGCSPTYSLLFSLSVTSILIVHFLLFLDDLVCRNQGRLLD